MDRCGAPPATHRVRLRISAAQQVRDALKNRRPVRGTVRGTPLPEARTRHRHKPRARKQPSGRARVRVRIAAAGRLDAIGHSSWMMAAIRNYWPLARPRLLLDDRYQFVPRSFTPVSVGKQDTRFLSHSFSVRDGGV